MTIKRAGLFSIHKLLLSGFAALAFVLQPFSGILIQTAAALVPPAGANTVCAVGCTTTTVQAGLDLGGTVFVHNGTYTEQLTFTHDDTTLIGESQLGVILKPLSNSYGQGLTSQLKTNITVKNLSIQTNAASGGYALKAYGGYNLTLQDLSISGNGTNGGGVDINSVPTVHITNVTAGNFGKNGFAFTSKYTPADQNTRDVYLKDISAANNDWAGIAFYNVGSAGGAHNFTNVQFQGTNTIFGNSKGLEIVGATDADVAAHAAPSYITVGTSLQPVNLGDTTFSDNGMDIINYQAPDLNATSAHFTTKIDRANQLSLGRVISVTTPTNAAFTNPATCGAYTNVIGTVATWSAVNNAVAYNYRSWKVGDPTYGTEATAYTVHNVPTNSQPGTFSLGNGTYYFQAQAVDAFGAASDWSTSCAATYDTTKPVIVVNTANGSLNPATISATATDNTQLKQVTAHIYNDTNTVLVSNCSTNVSALNVSSYTISCNTAGLAEGTYTIRANASDKAGNLSATVSSTKFTIDHTAPTGLSHVSPVNGSFMTTATALQIDWTDATDPHGPLSYYYESSLNSAANSDGSFVTPIYQSSALNTSHIPTPNTPAGVYYWHVRATDALNNSTAWTSAWKITVDNTKPVIVVNTANGSVNPATVSVTGTDNTELKQVTGHIYNEANTTLIKNCSTNVAALNVGTYTVSCSTSGLVDGVYTIRANALDKAGNLSTTLSSTKFTIDNTDPHVTALDFGTWGTASPDFKAINLGFELADFKTVTDITVDLYDASGKFVTNTASPAFLTLINANNWTSLSSPFVVSGTLTDTFCAGGPCWIAGVHNWAAANKPVKAVVTVDGTRLSNTAFTDDDETTAFVENDGTFEGLLPLVLGVSTDDPAIGFGGGTLNTFSAISPLSQLASAQLATTAGDTTVVENDAVLDAEKKTATNTDASDGEVLADSTTTPASGLAWYWWVLIAAAAVSLLWWIIAAMRRRSENA